ncbi:MICAL-like protein 2 [Triplophysa tibetana]|uniref:MICAL-like protein 2 n=1 Tax=Triplophysa tibetana TaxID=1572043 RepID=A0A5A9PL62_9TELE|nr:MICAL-like protein 2 [Triplophysa tibetana]
MAAVKALQQWCKIQCDGYRDVSITNMTTSFRDGMAFCALIHKHRPDLIDFDSLSKENIYENNQLAFQVAENELGIPALLDAEDMLAMSKPDRLSILTYVSQYYNYFHGRSPKAQKPKSPNDNKREVLAERANKQGTLSSSCSVCSQHVHLVQRHLVDGKLYHRNCFKCKECTTILLSGTYKAGKEPGTFICKTHSNVEKHLTTPTTNISIPPPKTQPTTVSRGTTSTLKDRNSPGGGTGQASSTPIASKPGWLAKKSDRTPTRESPATPAPTPTPVPASRTTPASKTTPAPETTTTKTIFNFKTPTESPTTINNSLQKNQEARKRFFESSSNTSTITSTSKNSPSATSTTSGKGRVLLRVGDWAKVQDEDKEKENEREKAKTVIGKIMTGTKNPSGSSQSPAGLTGNGSNVSSVESGVKGPSGRVCLNPLDDGLDPTAPAAGTPSWIKNKNSSRPASSLSSNSKGISSPNKKPEAQASGVGISQTSGSAPSTTNASPGISRPKAPSASPLKNGSSDSKSASSVSPVSSSGTETHKLHKPDHIPKEEILKELKEIEMNLNELEKRGVELEKELRQSDEDGEEDTLMNDLMVDWFSLIRNKQVYMRRESELVYIAKTQDLEEEQPSVEAELRRLMEKPDHLKTSRDRKQEEELMAKLVEIVNDRNAIIEGLDEDRLREGEEDEQLNKMMQDLDVKKVKVKRKSSISRWLRGKSKRPTEEE